MHIRWIRLAKLYLWSVGIVVVGSSVLLVVAYLGLSLDQWGLALFIGAMIQLAIGITIYGVLQWVR